MSHTVPVSPLAIKPRRNCEQSLNFTHQLRFRWIVTFALLVFSTDLAADDTRYKLVSREVIETRLGKYKGNDQQREEALKQLFAEAGCDGQNISEQPVKGSRLPNVVCLLSGSSDKVIIVGAHFDHISAGDGVVDNWSGAALLPSLYQGVKIA